MCRPLVVGDAGRLREAGRIVGSALAVEAITSPGEASDAPGTVACIDLGLIPPGHPFGMVSPVSGEAAFPLYRNSPVRSSQAGEARGDLHRAVEQGGPARRRPQVSGPHGYSCPRSPARRKSR